MKNKIFNYYFYVTTTKFQCGDNMTCSQCSVPLSPGMWTDDLITPKSVKNPRLIYDIFCNFLDDQQFYHFHCKNHSSQPFIVVRQKGFNPTTKQDKVFKSGPSKTCGRHLLKSLKGYDWLKQTISLQVFQRLSCTNFTRSIFEYFFPNEVLVKFQIIKYYRCLFSYQ